MLQHAVFMTIFLIININKNNNYDHLDSRKIFLWMTSQYNRVSWLVFLLIALVWHKGDILVMLTKVKLFKFVIFNSYWSNPPLLYWACYIVDFPKIRQENPCHESRWRIHGICPPYLFSKSIFLIIESEYLFGKGRTSFWIASAYKFVKMRWTETSASIKHHISAWQNVFSSQAVQCLGCAKGDYMNQSDI